MIDFLQERWNRLFDMFVPVIVWTKREKSFAVPTGWFGILAVIVFPNLVVLYTFGLYVFIVMVA